MHDAWVRLIATGSPGRSPYDLRRRATMIIDEQWPEVADPFRAEREVWN